MRERKGERTWGLANHHTYLFSGEDFVLIPSHDEPFDLVAVEFGCKGALGVGSRLGGLGLMPDLVCGCSSQC